jgi:hypothetical protein
MEVLFFFPILISFYPFFHFFSSFFLFFLSFPLFSSYLTLKGSQLTITIGKGSGQWQNQTILVDLCLGKQSFQTKPLKGNTVTWNESFSFNVSTGQEQLILTVMTQGQQNLGQVYGNLEQLKDQQSHQEELTINGIGVRVGVRRESLMWKFNGFGASFRCTRIIFRMHRRIIIWSNLFLNLGIYLFSI